MSAREFGGGRNGVRVLAAVAVLAVVVLAAQRAQAAVGDLTYQGCLSSNINQTTCTLLGASSAGGNHTPLDQLIASAESLDGRNLYVTSGGSDAVNTFTRDPATGALTFSGCLTGDTDVVGCTPISGATAGGVNNGVDSPFAIAVSADGKSLYTANIGSDSLAHYSRDPATGALSYGGCVSSDTAQNTKCAPTPVAAAGGTNTALDFPEGVAVSPDGRSIYVASRFASALSRFSRDPVTGAFGGFQNCITGDTDVSADPNVTHCTPVTGANTSADNTGFSSLNSVTVSPDNKTVFATASNDSDLLRFSRNTATGAVTFQGCVSSDTAVANCTATPTAGADGDHTGLEGPDAVVVSPDNANVYVAAYDGEAISRFKLDPATGAFGGYQDCLTSESTVSGCTFIPGAATGDDNSPLDALGAVAVSPNGAAVYAGALGGDALTRFDRDAATGALGFNSCTTSNTNVGACAQLPGAVAGGLSTPLSTVEAVVPSADGKNVYAISVADAISRFDVEGLPPTPPSNDFSISGVTKNKRKGTAMVTVTVPGPGDIGLAGNGVASKSATATEAGDVTVQLKAKDNKRKKLRRKGKVKVTAQITFTPTGGSANTEPSKVKLIRR
jgi:sugar lactone lactonase YvrE